MKLIPILVAVVALAAQSAMAAIIYDGAADYSTTTNPNGVWSSGYTTSVGSALQLYDLNHIQANGVNDWYSSNVGVAPVFAKNVSSSTVEGIAPGQLNLHPGANLEFTVLRFTAPSAGIYTLSSQFFVGNTGDTDAYVLLNGDAGTPLFYAPTTDVSPSYNNVLSLSASDRLDFVVGAKGSYFSDATPLDVRLTSAVPEPETYAMMLSGIGVMGFVARRRKQKEAA